MPLKPIVIAALAASVICPPPLPGQVQARVKIEGEPELHGVMRSTPDGLMLEADDGKSYAIDPDQLRRIDVDLPRVPMKVGKLGSGELPEPWKQTAVGDLPHGGRAVAKSDRAIVETSSPEKGSTFDAFYMAYRPLPAGDAQITAGIGRIFSYEDTTRAGLMLRDGTGPDAHNVFLSLSHREPAAMRVWKNTGGAVTVDGRGGIRPGKWLRIDRAGGKVSGYVSEDSSFWREIASTKDIFEGQVYACLAAQGSKPRRRWSATYQNVDVTPLSLSGPIRIIQPRITLADGTIFHSPVQSATPKLLKLAGDNAGRVLPIASIARIEFYRPITHTRRHVLEGERPGVLLPNGDFFEANLSAISNGILIASSTLFGKREFKIGAEVDALVLRPAKETPPDGDYRVETWAGTELTGKNLRFEAGNLVIDTVRLRTQSIPLEQLWRVTRSK